MMTEPECTNTDTKETNWRKWIHSNIDTMTVDPAHSRQVHKLCVQIFQELSAYGSLQEEDKQLLELAAFLHDIGIEGIHDENHHKTGRDKILKLDIPGIDPDRLNLVAMIARYHRKSEPDVEKHPRYARLQKKERNRIDWLAGILRVADGLDRSHGSIIQKVVCRNGHNHMDFILETTALCDPEIAGAMKKCGLLARKLRREIRFLCSD